METLQYSNNINFHFTGKRVNIEAGKSRKWLLKAASNHGYKIKSLSYVFCSDEELLLINQQHLNHDYYTDIITFDLGEATGGLEGEIYISIDRVKENAKSNSVSIKSELKRVMIHGLLHLMGYKDKKKSDALRMRLEEDKWITLFPSFT